MEDATPATQQDHDDLIAHTQPYRGRGWSDLFVSVALILVIGAAGYYGYQWLMGDLPPERTRWIPIGLVIGLFVGPVVSTLVGPRPGSAPNVTFGIVVGGGAGVALAGALAAL